MSRDGMIATLPSYTVSGHGARVAPRRYPILWPADVSVA